MEQQVVDRGLVVERDVGNFGRQGEDDVEVPDRQQVSLPLGEPGACSGTLAFGAVPVTAAVVGDPPVAAIFASLDMTVERCRSARVIALTTRRSVRPTCPA